jgi:VIT1/CCC1 family predicted Fe2+/Mn2+ transporter
MLIDILYFMSHIHLLPEKHYIHRIGWLRAAVLGANDGILSTASLIVGVAAANSSHNNILLAGVAGLIAGAMSMAAGEYVSVSSQADTERADLARERHEHKTNNEHEHEELANIYINRGLDQTLAAQVAKQLMTHDAIGAHARDELGISDSVKARPIQAALASAGSFSVGAILPLLMVIMMPLPLIILTVSISSLAFLAILGVISARIGGSSLWIGALRVTFWGAFAMGVTAGIGALFGVR